LIAIDNNAEFTVKAVTSGPGESITLTLLLPTRTINITVFYRPPAEHHIENLTEIIDHPHNIHPNIYLGDFNLPGIDWSSQPGGKSKIGHTTKTSTKMPWNCLR